MISLTEHVRRRKKILKEIGKDSVAIMAAAPITIRNRDVEHPYRPDSNFYYLTGFVEPESLLLLIPGRKNGSVVMFCRERDPAMEIWNGERLGPDGVCRQLGIDEAFSISEIDKKLPELLAGRQRLYSMIGMNPEFDQQMFGWVNQLRHKNRLGVKAPTEFFDLGPVLHEMRLVKSKSELALMRRAIAISTEAHILAMKKTRPGKMEYEIESDIVHVFNRCKTTVAYSSIVGAGKNSCVLHYVDNDQQMNSGDLLLIDAGAENAFYAADITRTFPVNGRFSQAQKIIYTIVLGAQEAAIKQIKPGNYWNAPHLAAVKEICKGLIKTGLLKGPLQEMIKSEAYKKYFMHGTGHWLGMDVHDVGDYKIEGKWREFEPGMTLTVEPGIYIPPGSKKVAKKWWNIGIRIEDDVLVTATGNEVLSKKVPKEIDEIEALVGSLG